MCLAIPGKIVELVADPPLGVVEVTGVRRRVDLGLLQDDPPQVGDWVLIHVGFAMSKIDEEEAQLALASLQMMGAAYTDEVQALLSSGSSFDARPGWSA
jgi:hydrogenase expression/formation protein HypC